MFYCQIFWYSDKVSVFSKSLLNSVFNLYYLEFESKKCINPKYGMQSLKKSFKCQKCKHLKKLYYRKISQKSCMDFQIFYVEAFCMFLYNSNTLQRIFSFPIFQATKCGSIQRWNFPTFYWFDINYLWCYEEIENAKFSKPIFYPETHYKTDWLWKELI